MGRKKTRPHKMKFFRDAIFNGNDGNGQGRHPRVKNNRSISSVVNFIIVRHRIIKFFFFK